MKKAGLLSILLVAVLLAVAIVVEAQPQAKIPRIGYLSRAGNTSNPGPYVEALRQGPFRGPMREEETMYLLHARRLEVPGLRKFASIGCHVQVAGIY